jgi:hypothetical protein
MLRRISVAFALIASATCLARPLPIAQSQAIDAPAGYYFFGYSVAIDGDWAIIAAATPSATPTSPQQTHDALLYHRVGGVWTLDRTLVRQVSTRYDQYVGFGTFAMSNGVAAIGSNPIRMFKRTNNTWNEITHPFAAPPGSPDYVGVGGAMVWDGNQLLVPGIACNYFELRPWGALVSRLSADGSWSKVERVSSNDPTCNQFAVHWDISGNTAVAGAYTNDFETIPDQLHVFRRAGGNWTLTSSIDGGDAQAAVRGDEFFQATSGPRGTLVYRNDDTQTVIDTIRDVSASIANSGSSYDFVHTNDLFMQQNDLYRKNDAGRYEHVAILRPTGNYALTGEPKISGRRVIYPAYNGYISSNQSVLFFDLPATFTPSPVIATGFENGGSTLFNAQAGAFAVATAAHGNHVYRQSSLTGDYRALVGNSDWIEQSIEADIKPTAFSGPDRWAGLAVRYLDPSNYYYVTMRSSGVIALKVMRNGVVSTMAERGLPVVAGRSYRVALKTAGPLIVVRVDGRDLMWSQEAQPIPHGSAALVGYRTAVEYDNVVAAQVAQRPIFDLAQANCSGPVINTPEWSVSGMGTWNCSGATGERIQQQTSTAGDARAVAGTPTPDQVVTARARATAFASGQDRWFGIAARYVDPSNYYYLTVRSSNTVSLRKVVNGVVTVLGTVSLPVTTNTWYDLRLDAVGHELRAFVNGTQVLQAVDSSHASGQGGILMFRAAAEYVNYYAWEP